MAAVMLLDHPLPSRRAKESAPTAPVRRAQPHHCGLLHRPDRGEWSVMAAILSWMLRPERTKR
jgi:hypothetical protein